MSSETADSSSPGTTENGNRTEPWWGSAVATVRTTVKQFSANNMTDTAAALTYYSVLSVFPGLLVLVSGVAFIDVAALTPIIDGLTRTAPEGAGQVISDAMRGLATSGSASLVAIAGAMGAIWAASAYVAALQRALNIVYEANNKPPLWKALLLRLVITVVVGILLIMSATIVVFTGKLAEGVGEWLGFGGTAVTVWGIAKWPILLLLVALIITILYWASPNTDVGGVMGLMPGGLLAVALWVTASAGFAVYVANFGSYNQTYGALGGVIVFFIWMWVTNLAILFGAQFNAIRLRSRTATDS